LLVSDCSWPPVAPFISKSIKTIVMKKQLVARIRMYGKSLFFTTSTILILNISAKAQAVSSKAPVAENAEVTHLESKEDNSLFQVKIPNETGEKFSLVIKDASGVILFNEVYADKNFDKKFLVTNVDKDAKLLFTIRSLKDKKGQTFETNAVSRIVDDVVVTKL
jgi:hypothetical protein